MGTYIIGDLHGQMEALRLLLGQIEYQEEADTLCFVGDYVDWGPQSMELLQYVMELDRSPRVHCLLGNHDWMMREVLADRGQKQATLRGESVWARNRGDETLRSFCELPTAEQEAIQGWLEKRPVGWTTEINGRRWYAAHAGPLEAFEGPRAIHDAVWKRLAPQEDPFARLPEHSGSGFICGHTINEKRRIRREAHFIDIDCGAKVLQRDPNAALAALRLEDGAEFYVHGYDLGKAPAICAGRSGSPQTPQIVRRTEQKKERIE